MTGVQGESEGSWEGTGSPGERLAADPCIWRWPVTPKSGLLCQPLVGVIRRALALALLLSSLSVGVAVASAGPNHSHLTATYFTADYDNGPGGGGVFTCAGEHIVRTAPRAFTKDLEVCSISDVSSLTAGTYRIVTAGTGSGLETLWFSDYDGHQAVSGAVIVIAHKNGTGTVLIDANY